MALYFKSKRHNEQFKKNDQKKNGFITINLFYSIDCIITINTFLE